MKNEVTLTILYVFIFVVFSPSGALLKAMLIHSGQEVRNVLRADLTLRDTSYGDYTQGYGRIQLDRVLSFGEHADGTLSLFVVGAADSASEHYAEIASEGEEHVYEFRVGSSSEALKITLGTY